MSGEYNLIKDSELIKVVEEAVEFNESDLYKPNGISDHSYLVGCFARLSGDVIPNVPTIPDEKTRILRAKLILEEALETVEALGVSVYQCSSVDAIKLSYNDFSFKAEGTPDLVEIIDGCLDVRVVTTGTLVACGVQDHPMLQDLVDFNNLAKFRKDKDGYRREDGKWVKPTDHPKPRIPEYLEITKG